MFFVMDESVIISARAFKNTVAGAILEFTAILTVYYSYKYIEASRSSVIQSLKGIFVLIGAFFVFKTLPLPHQLWGGIITVIGVLIMALAQAGYLKNPFAKETGKK
jgi:drug/metabolite transporter (DMT)-like permease